MPEILYKDTGLEIRRNDHNKFCVVKLHYTADPNKRSLEWRKEAQAGMRPADWAKEYEIDFGALSGDLAFPVMKEAKEHIVVKRPYPDFGRNLTYYGGLDYGSRNPSSVHFYTIVNGITYCVWELYEPCVNIDEFVQKVRSFPYWGSVKYIAADPTIFGKTTRNRRGLPASMYELFTEKGLSKIIRGNNDEQAWLAKMREHWAIPETPTFKIFDCCPNIIREFENAVYSTMSDKQKMASNWKESLADHNNHAMDDCKYFMNSHPKPTLRSHRRTVRPMWKLYA